jgi:hypothetical protein
MDIDRELALRYLAARGIVLPEAGVEWGERLCRSYDTAEGLIALVLPWFRQGLEDDERCIWQLGRGFSVATARRALATMADYTVDQVDIVEADAPVDWVREETRALGQGYAGLRIGGERLHRLGTLGPRTRTLCFCAAG